MTVDGYNKTYAAEETSEVTIDLLVGILASLVGFVSLIGLVLIFGWFKKKFPKI